MSLAKVVVKVKTRTRQSAPINFASQGVDVYSPHSYFDTYIKDDISALDCDYEYPTQFDVRSTRYHRLLYFMACRLLSGRDGADEAVRNCLLRASCDPPVFGSEGAFRSWLIRILIDEALLVLQERKNEPMMSFQEDASEIA